MDVILANYNGIEECVVPYDLDIEVGTEDTFEIGIPRAEWDGSYAPGKMVYIYGTEFGGIIGGLRSETDPAYVYVRGRTWRGGLRKKIISPASGDDYYTISGDLNSCISQLLNAFYADSLVIGSSEDAGQEVNGYRFARYTDLMSGIEAMCASVGYRPKIVREEAAVVVTAEKIRNYSEAIEFSEDSYMGITAEVIRNGVNHLICLGQGELHERTVVHIYTDRLGNVTSSQVLTGRDEVAEVYDDPAATTAAELRENGLKRLEEIKSSEWISADSFQIDEELEIGDIVSGVDYVTGIKVSKPITKKILKIIGEIPFIEYALEGEE